ncbi:MAG TPA: hypothetical protein VNN18_07570 [Candidatus Xenobia bacterium]|nr:hypothetical protein [Candidatus Xenobia bacterium]
MTIMLAVGTLFLAALVLAALRQWASEHRRNRPVELGIRELSRP